MIPPTVLADTILNYTGDDVIVTRFNDGMGEVLVFTDTEARDSYVAIVSGDWGTGEFTVDMPERDDVIVPWARRG
jgi:hypothetical protein